MMIGKKTFLASTLASLIAAPSVFADPPDKERKEAYNAEMKRAGSA